LLECSDTVSSVTGIRASDRRKHVPLITRWRNRTEGEELTRFSLKTAVKTEVMVVVIADQSSSLIILVIILDHMTRYNLFMSGPRKKK